jgi:hypothetical protein
MNMKQTKNWVLAATRTLAFTMLLCGSSVFTACSSNDDNPVPEKPLSEKLLGKWMISELDNQPCPTNLKAVITFLSPTEAYGSLSDFYSDSWNSHASAVVTIDGSKVSLTANENEHITHVTKVDISRITDTDMWLSSDWRVYKDGEEIGGEIWGNERYERITNDYEKDIIGTWEGKVTSDKDEHTDGELHRWEYKSNGTYVYYSKVDGDWKASTDNLSDYFVDGTLLCTRWKKTSDSEEIREWWEIESIQNGKMKWKALRMRDDTTTYIATFEMTKVE